MVDDWELLDHEDLPHGQGTLFLSTCDGEYAIYVDGRELMANTLHGSEDALADLACDRLERLEDARVLVGGLGMGFTLAAVLRRIGAHGVATVAELVPSVVRWNREVPGMGDAAGHPLRDPRVVVHLGDVGDLMEAPPALWSAILLDVDNGPFALTRWGNGWLYTHEGLDVAWNALIPGGVLGIWSADEDPSLTERLEQRGFEVDMVHHTEEGRATDDDSGTQFLWIARRP